MQGLDDKLDDFGSLGQALGAGNTRTLCDVLH